MSKESIWEVSLPSIPCFPPATLCPAGHRRQQESYENPCLPGMQYPIVYGFRPRGSGSTTLPSDRQPHPAGHPRPHKARVCQVAARILDIGSYISCCPQEFEKSSSILERNLLVIRAEPGPN